MSASRPPIYLLELFSYPQDDLEDADVFARLDTAVERAYLHAKSLAIASTRVEVSTDGDGAIDGVGFFDKDSSLLACVTVYQMERDTEEPSLDSIRLACSGSADQMQEQLGRLLAIGV